MFAVGADIGGTSVKIGVFEDSGKIMAKSRIPTRKDDNCRYTAAEIKRLLRANHIEPGEVLGIGAGVPGPVADGVVMHCVNLHWTDKVDAAARLEEMTGIRTSLINDANAAALGEQWMGAGRGRKSMVFVTIGTGVGGGIIIGGNVLTGAGGAAGEIGHITVENGGRACNCGRKGCFEAYASASALVRRAAQAAQEHPESRLNALTGGDAVRMNGRIFFQAVREKDGRKYYFVLNYKKTPVKIQVKEALVDLYTGETVSGQVELEAFGTKVYRG